MSDTRIDEFGWLPTQAAELPGAVAVPTVVRGTVTTDAGALSYVRWGSSPAQAVLLHGAGLNVHTFDTTLLAAGIPAIALDLPGHGDSDWRDDADYAPATIAPAVANAIAQLVDGPIVLVGHSLGGLTAAWIAAHRPELVSALVLLDITPGIDPSAGPQVLHAFYAQTEFPSREAVADWAEGFGMGGSRAALERGVFFNTRVREDGSVEWKHHFARLATAVLDADSGTSITRGDAWADLAAAPAPITLVAASDGFVSSDAVAEFTHKLPHARVIPMTGTHNLQETDPAGLGALLFDIAQSR